MAEWSPGEAEIPTPNSCVIDMKISRRHFLKTGRATVVGLPGFGFVTRSWMGLGDPTKGGNPAESPSNTQKYFVSLPHRLTSPVDRIIEQVVPGRDAFVSEKYALELGEQLKSLSAWLRGRPLKVREIANLLAPDFRATRLKPQREQASGSNDRLSVFRGEFSAELTLNQDVFVHELEAWVEDLGEILVAEFLIPSLTVNSTSDSALTTTVRYDVVGSGKGAWRSEKNGQWEIDWAKDACDDWRIIRWKVISQTRSQASTPVFTDVTDSALGGNLCLRDQLGPGIDDWREILDGALGVDIFGNNGVAIGDIDGDGLDDFYVCQPSGLPNLLFRNQGDGTFVDVTESAGVGVLDSSSMAIFADVDNDGAEDLIVVTWKQPLLFMNNGNGKFALEKDAFRFAQLPKGAFTAGCMADYDRDGYLDLYLCSYNYFLAEGSYRLATPYFDANNGPPNVLFHNNGDGTFSEVTESIGMDQNNHRFSFACAWADYDQDGWPDLYVANDYGRNNLYRSEGRQGGRVTFRDAAAEAGVEDIGPGMSASWLDYNNDGLMDLYVGNMWTAAGLRITGLPAFQSALPSDLRNLYRQHVMGNSLFRNRGDGTFQDVTAEAGVEMGRWAWSCDALDFDNDGWQDLYITNGMITNSNPVDLSSFFWRQVVAQSPLTAERVPAYEDGWRAINRLIREGYSWNGHERNVFFRNDGQGSFDPVSGAVGLDFDHDGRAFAVFDYDLDGDADILHKSRTGPQLRLLRNDYGAANGSVSFRLVGTKSNRDAVGAAVTVESEAVRQTKIVQAGSGFLSQHSKELLFGLGKRDAIRRVLINWPSGLRQILQGVPVNHRIFVQEGKDDFEAKSFRPRVNDVKPPGSPARKETRPHDAGTWLYEPYPAPDFKLEDSHGRERRLSGYRGRPVVMNFWAFGCPPCRQDMKRLRENLPKIREAGVGLLVISTDSAADRWKATGFARELGMSEWVLFPDDRMIVAYNILNKYLFDANQDLQLPSTFLLDAHGEIVKVYRGPVPPAQVLFDLEQIPATREERLARALPFGGTFHAAPPGRNYFQFGIYFSEHGLDDLAIEAFQETLRVTPNFAKAHYNLGTLYMKREDRRSAESELERAIELEPDYPEAHNNLGTVLAQQGRLEEGIAQFQAALASQPDYPDALNNLGYAFLQSGKSSDAIRVFEKALSVEPGYPEALNNLGIAYSKEGDLERAKGYFQKAWEQRRSYVEAANNLAIVDQAEGLEEEAVRVLKEALEIDPNFEPTYLNLAQVYLNNNRKEDAIAVLKGLLGRNPNRKEARRILQQLGAGNP